MPIPAVTAERGKQLRFLILPSARHLMYQDENETSPVGLLKDRLREDGLGFLDATDHVLSELNGREICRLFTHEFVLARCGGQHNELGNEIIRASSSEIRKSWA